MSYSVNQNLISSIRTSLNRNFEKLHIYIAISIFIHLTILGVYTVTERAGWLRETKLATPKQDLIDVYYDNTQKNSQIVQTQKVEKSQETTKDAFLSEQTQLVREQTKAKTVDKMREATAANTASTPNKAQPTPEKTNVPIKSKSARPDLKLADLGVAIDFKKQRTQSNAPSATGQKGAVSTDAATNDYLRDVADGRGTLLNTKEYAYYGFYQRVRAQLEQYWEPSLRNRLRSLFSRGRSLASEVEHSTRLVVVLNRTGAIEKVLVQNTSGYVDLDEAAIDAFRKAGPFPNPPVGLVDRDGTVKVAWEFVLKT